MRKHKAVFDFFNDCPLVNDKFFNFSKGENGNTIIATIPSEPLRTYIDGTKLQTYQFMVKQVKSISYIENDELNVDNIELVEELMEWITLQNKNKNYPAIDGAQRIEVLSNMPGIAGADDKGALYAFTCQILYLERK